MPTGENLPGVSAGAPQTPEQVEQDFRRQLAELYAKSENALRLVKQTQEIGEAYEAELDAIRTFLAGRPGVDRLASTLDQVKAAVAEAATAYNLEAMVGTIEHTELRGGLRLDAPSGSMITIQLP